jgi:formate/nitrite transporter FocA (FNT family)
VLGATAARDIAGKVIAVFFPIMAFVLCGYEHSIANMYFIPAGISAAANPAYVEKAVELYGYTAEKIAMMDVGSFFSNIIPVTLGNTVGGIAIGLIMYAVYKSKLLNKAQ